jgi:integrase
VPLANAAFTSTSHWATCATLLLSKNVNPKIVQELLGHTSIQLTLDTYSHYLPDMQEKAVDAMQSALKTPFRDGPEAQ